MKLSGMNPGEALHKLLQRRWLVWLVNSLLAVWLVWLVADATWQHFQPAPEPEVPVAPPPPPVATPDKLPAEQMADWHLFGVVDEQEKKKVTRMLNAPETKLKLSLKGIVATDNHLDGYAIIQKPDKEELHFKVKDSVFGLATLEEIYVDRVILLRNGRHETLRLPIEFMAADPFLERERKKEAKRIVSDFRHKLVNRKGMELIKMFGFDTAYKNGGFYGFKVKIMGEEGARMLEALGVEEDDLITAVNGKRFAESIEATQSLTKLKDAKEVDVEIERNGVPMFFHFDFADIEETSNTMDDETDSEEIPHDGEDSADPDAGINNNS